MEPAVLVVGAGPVGLTMAAELARYGVPVRIIEKAAGRTDKSKALVIWSRTLELLDRAGCGQKFVNIGHKVTAANIVAGEQQLGHLRLDVMHTPHPYALMLPQSETERLLEEHLTTLGVRVERQVAMTAFTPAADSVAAIFRHVDGREEKAEFAWLIGCDGAHSTVRHGLGMQFEGDTLPSDWILADVQLAGIRTKPDELSLFWHKDGLLAFFPISGNRYRVIADVGDGHGEQRADPTIEEVQTIIDRRGPGEIIASSPIWLASFRINERKVANYRAGRVFVAGDAAHVHSPAGGQGMNTGMQDAFNLAWKLAMVYRGFAAAEPLLDSYSLERSAVGRQVLKDAGHLTALAIVRSGVLQSIRNHAASLFFGLWPVRKAMANKLAELSIGYPHSPLTGVDRSGVPGPVAGDRAPISDTLHPVGCDNTPRFAIFAKPNEIAATLIARYPNLLEAQLRPPFADGGIWLVRPDGYVAMTANDRDWPAIEQYLQDSLGGH